MNTALFTDRDIHVRRLSNSRFTEKQLREIVTRMRKVRRERGMTRTQLADKLGVSKTTVLSIEHFTLRPSAHVLARLYELEKSSRPVQRKRYDYSDTNARLDSLRRTYEYLREGVI